MHVRNILISALSLVIFGYVSQVFAVTATPTGVTMGKYTYDYKAALDYARAHHRPLQLLQGRLPENCQVCRTGQGYYDSAAFKDWAGTNDIPLVYGNYDERTAAGVAAFNWVYGISRNNNLSLSVILDEDGVTKLGEFQIAASMPLKPWQGGTISSGPNATHYGSVVQAYVESYDDVCTRARKLTVSSVPSVWRMYHDWGTNTLRTVVLSGRRYSDPTDWYCIENAPAKGMALRLYGEPEYFKDSKNYAKVLVFDGLPNAQKGTEEAAMFPVMSLKDFCEKGITIKDAKANTYLKIYRSDDIDQKEVVDVTYSLVVSEEKLVTCKYSTDQRLHLFTDDAGEQTLTVKRTEAGPEKTIQLEIDAAYDEDLVGAGVSNAVENTDFVLKAKSVTFAADALTATVKVGVNYDSKGYDVPVKAFKLKLKLEEDEVAEDGYPDTNIVIYHADAEGPEKQVLLNATDVQQDKVYQLSGADLEDEFVLTNAVCAGGSLYSLMVDKILPVRDFDGAKIKVELFRVDKENPTAAELARCCFFSKEIDYTADGGYVSEVFGSDTVDGMLKPSGDRDVVVVRISRPQATKPNPIVRYRLRWRRYVRPVVSLAKASVSVPNDRTNREERVGVSVTGIDAIREVHTGFALTNVGWMATADAVSGVKATEDDFDAVTDGCVELAADAGAVSLPVTVKALNGVRPDEHQFLMVIKPSTDELYACGDVDSCLFTLAADEVRASPPATVKMNGAVRDWEWAGEAVRNLSYTNVIDKIVLTNVVGTAYETTNTWERHVVAVREAAIKPDVEKAETNFVAKVETTVTNYEEIVFLDGESLTNGLTGTVTCKVVTNRLEATVAEEDWEAKARELAEGLEEDEVELTKSERADSIRRRTYYRLRAEDVLVLPETAEVTVTAYANGVATGFSYNLADLAVDEMAAPILYFDTLAGDEAELWVERPADTSVRVEYRLALRQWEKPTVCFHAASLSTNDTVDAFQVKVCRTGNVDDEITVALKSENRSTLADAGYYRVPSTVVLEEGVAETNVTVEIAEAGWNATHWTGDRHFTLTLLEEKDCGAIEFADPSVMAVTLAETNGNGLDEADPTDDVRSGVISDAKAIDIPDDGTATNLVRTLHGSAGIQLGDPFPVNDTNDWFHITGLKANERYSFKCAVSNLHPDGVKIGAKFYRGVETEPFAVVEDFAAAGYLYDSESDDDIFVCVSRDTMADGVASVDYALAVAKYVWPVIGFDEARGEVIEVTNTAGRVEIGFTRKDNLQDEVPFELVPAVAGWAANVVDASSIVLNHRFADGSSVTNTAISLSIPEEDHWVGDWEFDLALKVDENLYRYDVNGLTNVTVRVIDGRSAQKDAGDSADDEQSGANVVTADGVAVTNHLNGIDGRTGSYSDRTDWFRLMQVEAESTYRFGIVTDASANVDGLSFSADLVYDGKTNVYALTDFAKGVSLPCPVADDVFVRVRRSATAAEIPVYFRYALSVEKIAWPDFALKAPAECANDREYVEITVVRSDNTNGNDKVKLDIIDENDVPVTTSAGDVLEFAPGATQVVYQAELVMTNGFWHKSGKSFRAVLGKVEDSPYVTLLAPTEAVVTVNDASGIVENDFAGDDSVSTAPEYRVSGTFAYGSNTVGRIPGVTWLNGGDTDDWYKVTGSLSGRKYRFEIEAVDGDNLKGAKLKMQIFEMVEDGDWGMKWEDLGIFPFDGPGVKVLASDDLHAGNFRIRIFRDGGDAESSMKYVFRFRELPTAVARFAESEKTVSEGAAAAYVDVILDVDPEFGVEENLVVTVTPQEVSSDAYPPETVYPARAGEDFDATPIVVTFTSADWTLGQDSIRRRVAIPLTNYDTRWEGSETFKAVLSSEQIDIAGDPEVRLTLVDKDAETFGTVGIVGIGDDLLKPIKNQVYPVREGDEVRLMISRVKGQAGWVNGVFTWKDGTKVVQTERAELFKGESAQESTVWDGVLTVPVAEGFQATRALSLVFAVECDPKKKVTITSGTESTLKFSVADANYAGTVAAYSAEDRSKVAFTTAGTSWYATTGGALASATPAVGKAVVMNATVTGPARLVFDAKLVDAENCPFYALVNGVRTELRATDPENEADANVVSIPAGDRMVQVILERPTKTVAATKDTAAAEVLNVKVVRDGEFQSVGTFTGPVQVKCGTERERTPGLGTMTVSTYGQLSGKFQCANRTWTFASSSGWTSKDESGRHATVKARSGSLSFDLTLTVDDSGTVAFGGDAVAGALVRNPWSDKPLAAETAALAATLPGYYTMSLADDGFGAKRFGSGYLTLTVGENGAVRASGMLADGLGVSLSGTVLPKAGGEVSLYCYTSPSAYRKGWICKSVLFGRTADGDPFHLADDPQEDMFGTVPAWVRFNSVGDDMFRRSVRTVGGWYDKTENLHNHYLGKALGIARIDSVSALIVGGTTAEARYWAADEAHAVSLAFNEAGTGVKATVDGGENLFTMNFARATGVFSGYVRVGYDYSLGTVSRNVLKANLYRGVLTPWRKNMADGVAGRGYFIMGEKAADGRLESVSYNLEISEGE